MRTDHAIFNKPLGPELDKVELRCPASYKKYVTGGEELPETFDAWQVQTGELMKDLDVGLVSDPYGFEDSPDAEWISGGNNSKGPRSAALARHGNFFLWGFSGDPTQMTESGRQVFLNVLHYMKGFAGKAPFVERAAGSREWAPIYAQILKDRADDDTRKNMLERFFGATIRVETEGDPERIAKYVAEHIEHLRRGPDGRAFVVDSALVEAGTSNRTPAFFEAVAARLKKDEDDEVALKLLERYAADVEAPTECEALLAWLAKHRERLFFSDVGGYRWYLAPGAK